MKHTREMIMNHQTEHPGTSLELLKLENRFDRFKLHTMDRMDKFENDIRGLTQTIRLLVSKPETRSDHRLTHEEMLRAWNAVHKCFSELEELRRP